MKLIKWQSAEKQADQAFHALAPELYKRFAPTHLLMNQSVIPNTPVGNIS